MNQKKVKIKFRSSNMSNDKINYSWIKTIASVTLLIASIISYVSLIFMEIVSIPIAAIILLLIVFVGIFFDVLGIAVTAADETPFHSMSASKVPASKESIWLIRNASIVSNFCNDVIGDICGIISGSASTAIVAKIIFDAEDFKSTLLSILFSAIIASITVGGKAIGKEIAIRRSNYLVYKIATVLHYVKLILPKRKKSS
ncbi:Mg2+ and Co2+ transporter CorB [Vallitalea okinawensis]|uniref:Mg2+ and Co2+ transporter CorB n=1 Tax=Vallitalea okinawensis TaxID=2078660 RepID=UPI001A9A2F1D|nr:Mg2+ and Co2+ transporter CorB [Vallitalea okinawensis]